MNIKNTDAALAESAGLHTTFFGDTTLRGKFLEQRYCSLSFSVVGSALASSHRLFHGIRLILVSVTRNALYLGTITVL